jgi:hypothetical protein
VEAAHGLREIVIRKVDLIIKQGAGCLELF